jgi:hypothetical protein
MTFLEPGVAPRTGAAASAIPTIARESFRAADRMAEEVAAHWRGLRVLYAARAAAPG